MTPSNQTAAVGRKQAITKDAALRDMISLAWDLRMVLRGIPDLTKSEKAFVVEAFARIKAAQKVLENVA